MATRYVSRRTRGLESWATMTKQRGKVSRRTRGLEKAWRFYSQRRWVSRRTRGLEILTAVHK